MNHRIALPVKKKRVKEILATILACALLSSWVGCAKASSSSTSSTKDSQAANTSTQSTTTAVSTEAPTTDKLSESSGTGSDGNYSFTDSSGRELLLPNKIERIAPSGPLAQIVLYTLCPEKMVGWASEFTPAQNKYIDSKYSSLPVFGNFYGDTLNLEAVMTAKPQVIIDIGEAKKTIKEDMDGIQEKTAIPTLFVKMDMTCMASAYETLGKITGEEKRAEHLIDYIKKTLSETEAKLKSIPENERKSVYYGQDEGLTALVAGTVHSDVIDYAGGVNVVQVEESVRGGAAPISMEQLIQWNPDVILFAPKSIYADVAEKDEWKDLKAIKSAHYYEIPSEPYNWMGRPPSVNRLIGIKWLSKLLYPDVFTYDMIKETQEFYQLFYHAEITKEAAKDLLANSSYK